jgi:hypothetical protein
LVCITGALATGTAAMAPSYALRAAAIVRAGVDPRLVDEVIWWRSDDLWFWALQALVICVRLQPNAASRPSPRSANGSRAATASSSQGRHDPARQNARLERAQNNRP